MKIGVLALQGDFAEHGLMLRQIGVETTQVRLPGHLEDLDGLIIPGGESTTIGKLATAYDLMEPLRRFGKEKAIWGTCAGAIFLSRDTHRTQPLLGLMDIVVTRNAFGRQEETFEADLEVLPLDKVDPDPAPFHAIFIRAPLIEAVENGAETLARLPDGRIVAAQQGHWPATSFHPELTSDNRFHLYFLTLVK